MIMTNRIATSHLASRHSLLLAFMKEVAVLTHVANWGWPLRTEGGLLPIATKAVSPTATRNSSPWITTWTWKWIPPQSNLQRRLELQLTVASSLCEKPNLGVQLSHAKTHDPQQLQDNKWVCVMVHILWDFVMQQRKMNTCSNTGNTSIGLRMGGKHPKRTTQSDNRARWDWENWRPPFYLKRADTTGHTTLLPCGDVRSVLSDLLTFQHNTEIGVLCETLIFKYWPVIWNF